MRKLRKLALAELAHATLVRPWNRDLNRQLTPAYEAGRPAGAPEGGPGVAGTWLFALAWLLPVAVVVPEGGPGVAGTWLFALAWLLPVAVGEPEGGPGVVDGVVDGCKVGPVVLVLDFVDGGFTPVQYWATVSPLAVAAADRFRSATEWLAAWEPLEAA